MTLERNELVTERSNDRTLGIDRMSVSEILDRIHDEDQSVASAVRSVLPAIEEALVRIVDSFRAGGRLLYVGAGTSGRLGVLDASDTKIDRTPVADQIGASDLVGAGRIEDAQVIPAGGDPVRHRIGAT